ncbi:fibronectin type III domain-containing protein [Paenibacillus planticolens]|uniref:Fibronectin type-III domain-containing protein n=1 Tax=Paenibacillus planticolens TaxID=2654976 RepID=A0ABX1ZNU6_9BACL|nr:fibronectin type III domain-containing protein [Paenibacillus planticolens]NOV01333.1 hypothetical protein [Paenibacillus planticolens]
MPDNVEKMIKIGQDTPPQFKNRRTGKWQLVMGEDEGYLVKSPSLVASGPFSGTATMNKEFTRAMKAFVISNDGNASLTITINDGEGSGDTYTVYAGAVFDEVLPPFTSITINTNVPFQAYGRYELGSTATIPEPEPDITPPDNVTNLTVTNLTATSLTLHWNASASDDCVGYDIFRGPTQITSVTGRMDTTYNVSGLTQATQYTFTVKAKDAAGNISSGTSTTVTTASSADTTPPENVTNLTTANITQTSLTLNWAASVSSDVASYDIYNGSTFLANVTATTYNVNGLAASTAYTFWVKAKDTSGNAASGTSVNATTSAPEVDTTPPTNVTNLTTSGLTQIGVTLNWGAATDNVGVTGYEIYNGATKVTTVSGTTLTYNATGLTASTQYTFTVKARDAAGNVSSGTSVTVTTAAAPPNPVTGLTVGTVTSSSVQLTWTANADHYEVSYSTDGTNYTVANGNVKGTSFTVTGLNASTIYTIKVAALDASNNRSTGNPTVQATTAASSGRTLVASDNFNRPNGAIGTAVTGQSWNAGGADTPPTIISNRVGFATGSTNFPSIDIGVSNNFDVEMDFILPSLLTGNISGVSARVNASNNQCLIFGASTNGTRAGFLTTLTGASTTPTTVNFSFVIDQVYRLKLEVRGNVYKGYIDGVLIQTYTDANNIGLTNTKHGFVFYTAAAPRGDNFEIYTV